MNRFTAALAAVGILLGLSSPALAQTSGTTKVISSCGTATYTAGKPNYPTQDTTGVACTSSGSGGGVAGVTASSGPTAVVAGTNKPMNEGLFSNLFITPVTPTGTQIDLSTPSGVAGADGSTIATTSNPLPTEVAAGGNVAAVKAASTSPATTDPALVVTQSPNPGSGVCPNTVAISQTVGTRLHVGTSSNRTYICSIFIANATSTQGWSLVEGTGTVCATGQTFLIGGASGTAQGSMAMANNRSTLKTGVNADDTCLLQSASTNISGFITYVDAP